VRREIEWNEYVAGLGCSPNDRLVLTVSHGYGRQKMGGG